MFLKNANPFSMFTNILVPLFMCYKIKFKNETFGTRMLAVGSL